jgi:hypothetical protein
MLARANRQKKRSDSLDDIPKVSSFRSVTLLTPHRHPEGKHAMEIAHSKEAKEICTVVDSLPPESRRYLREMVFRVAAVVREKKKRVAARAALAALSWVLVVVSAASGATPDLPATDASGKLVAASTTLDDDDEDGARTLANNLTVG